MSVDWRVLKVEARKTQKKAYATGTIKNLRTQWKAYVLFCTYFQLDMFKVTSDDLGLYVQFLSRTMSSYSAINNYLSGVKLLFSLADVEFPSVKTVYVQLVLKGIKRTKTLATKQAKALDPFLLMELYDHIDLANPFEVTIWCCILFGFYGMLRISQLCPKTYASVYVSQVLQRKDIVVYNKLCVISLEWSKTNQFKQKRIDIPLLSIPLSPLCPVSAFLRMCAMQPAEPESPAFIGSNGKPVLYSTFVKYFRLMITRSGRDAQIFSSHSMRRGGASWAFKVGIPDYLIQLQGDWASDCYKRYLDVSFEQKVDIFRRMTDRF